LAGLGNRAAAAGGQPGTRYDPAMTTRGARKASGTHSLWDTLTHPGTITKVLQREPTRDPADDLVSLEQGVPLRTSAFRKAGWRWRHGRLFLRSADAAVPIAWQSGMYYSARRAAEPLSGPVIVEAVEEITGADRFLVDPLLFRKIRLTASGQAWVIAVPTHDVPLVLAAFKAHGGH
jgi:hypothetical protein